MWMGIEMIVNCMSSFLLKHTVYELNVNNHIFNKKTYSYIIIISLLISSLYSYSFVDLPHNTKHISVVMSFLTFFSKVLQYITDNMTIIRKTFLTF